METFFVGAAGAGTSLKGGMQGHGYTDTVTETQPFFVFTYTIIIISM